MSGLTIFILYIRRLVQIYINTSMKRFFQTCVFIFLSFNAFSQDTLLINQSINKAIAYLNNRIENQELYFYVEPILKPISLYYNLPISSNRLSKNQYSNKEKHLIDLFAPLYRVRKLSDNDKVIIDSLSIIDRLMLYSLYGNDLYKKKYFRTHIDSLINWGGYDLSHAYLITLLQENKSFIPGKWVKYYLNKTQPLVIKMLPEIHKHYTDLDIEVMALLLYANVELDSLYISNLIAQQTPIGSWNEKPDESNDWMNDHTTVIALWALLEWKYKSDKFLYLGHPQFIERNKQIKN